jgi:L-asparaginase/Glu-tRNA(Gln) amidotransferase subunit D
MVLGAWQRWAVPKIKVLATGGIIARAQATQAEAGYSSGAFSVNDLIETVPQLSRRFNESSLWKTGSQERCRGRRLADPGGPCVLALGIK